MISITASMNPALTPAMQKVLERMSRVKRAPMYTMSVEAARHFYEMSAEVLDLPRVPLYRVESFEIPVAPNVFCKARLYAAGYQRLPILLFLHGGGFTVGNLETHDSLCRQLALQSGGAVMALDYRLAPEFPFPTAQNDAFAALKWLKENADHLGLDGRRLAVGGDSAGATLATVCAVMARDAGVHLDLQLLITPGTSAYQDTPSHQAFAHGYLLDRELLQWFFGHYVQPDQRTDWRFSPVNTTDLEGVAPAWFGLAECDPLVDEGIAYADQLRSSRVPVQLEIWRGVTHEFIKMGRALPEAIQAQDSAAQALKQAWATNP